MNLTSCWNCGVVLDKDALRFPEEIFDEDGNLFFDKGTWDAESRKYVPFVECPVCKEEVKK